MSSSSGYRLTSTQSYLAAAALLAMLMPQPAFGGAGDCPGDCNGDGAVSIAEVVTGVGVALGTHLLDRCLAADVTDDGKVAINELILAVGRALHGCAVGRATPTATITPTVTTTATAYQAATPTATETATATVGASPIPSPTFSPSRSPTPREALSFGFTDVTTSSGILHTHAIDRAGLVGSEIELASVTGGAAAGDYDGDGWPDLYVVTGVAGPDLLYRNLRDGTFVDVAAAAGVDLPPAHRSGPTFADFDGDGRLDLLVGGVLGARLRLFRNVTGSTFAEVTESAGIVGDFNSLSAAFADYDTDGDLDVALGLWGTLFDESFPQLWRNEGDGTFTNTSESAGVRIGAGLSGDLSFTPNFADLNGDSLPDLLVAADFRTTRYFLNQDQGRFRKVNTLVISDENGMGAAVADYDNDGDLDWFVSSIFDARGQQDENWGFTGNRLYRNRGDGRFDDVTDEAGVRNGSWGWGSCFADFDNDGFLDLFHVNGFGDGSDERTAPFHTDPSVLFIGSATGAFRERSAEAGLHDTGMGRGVVCFDYDRDGDIDLFILNNDQPPRLLRNDGGNTAHYLSVKLRGALPNSEAIGARIYATTSGGTQMRELQAGSNFVSQSPAIAHIGLGSKEMVDELRVVWPGGGETVLRDVPSSQFLVLEEP